MQKIAPKKNWNLDRSAFEHLLAWLDQSSGSAGQKYLLMHERLLAYFDRKNCLAPDELADEVLNRVARRLQEEGSIANEPARYCYIVARFVFQESLRKTKKDNLLHDEIRRQPVDSNSFDTSSANENQLREKTLNCLDHCTEALDDLHRKIIVDYYMGKERAKIDNRRALAAELGISINALSIRACRIRDKLEGCVKGCVALE